MRQLVVMDTWLSKSEIVSSLQAKAYDGVKHSVTQKETELRGQAHRQLRPLGAGFAPTN